jgi:hypothetical protein
MTSTSTPKGKQDVSKSTSSAFYRILTSSPDASTTLVDDPAHRTYLSLLLCANDACMGVDGDVEATSLFVPNYPLVREFCCNICGVSFVACFECKAQLKTIATVRKHLHRRHAVTVDPAPELGVTGGHESLEDSDDLDDDQLDVPGFSPLLVDQFPHCPPESQRFFQRNQLPDGGSKYLAGLACCELEAMEVSDLDPLEVKMVAQTAQLVSQLSRRNRTLLASLSESIVDVVKRQRSESLELEANPEKERRPFAISPITDPALLRSTFIKGKFAYLPNLPRPEARECVAHSYCLPSECVQNSLAFGHDLDEVVTRPLPLAPTPTAMKVKLTPES